MLVVTKKNASKIDLTKSLDNVFFSEPLFDGMDLVNYNEAKSKQKIWQKISSGIFSYLAPKYAYHKVPRIH